MAKRAALGTRPDGRLYARVTRRCVAILKHLTRSNRRFDLIEVARELHEQEYPEFFRADGSAMVPIKAARIRDYVSYLHELGLVVQADRRYELEPSFAKPGADSEWVQYLSDTARGHLARLIGVSPADLPARLERQRKILHKEGRVPTITALLSAIGVEGTRKEEVFRWSLYLYTDGEACPLEIRQYPHLTRRP